MPAGEYVKLSVSDTGVGIPGDKLTEIFESFTQVDASTARKYGGSGLGLAISQWAVRAHGGFIEVNSSIGGGSTFRIVLPIG